MDFGPHQQVRPRCFLLTARLGAICLDMEKLTRLTGEADDQRLHQRELSGEAAPPRDSVGQTLRAARLGRGDELSQVSRVLRIGKDYLDALETDRPEKLPGRTYAIGFVRSYANYLGLDAVSLVARYKLATAGLAESAPQVGPAPEPVRSRRAFGWTLPALAAAALLVYGAYELSRPPPSALKPAAVPAPTHLHAAAKRGRLARSKLSASLAPSVPFPHDQPAAGPVAGPNGQVFGVQNLGSRVALHARALTHVLVEGAGGKIYINRLLHPGDVYRVPNVVGLSLTTPDGGAVSLEVDGRDMGAAGSNGHIAEALPLDPRAIVDRKGAGVPGQPDKVTP